MSSPPFSKRGCPMKSISSAIKYRDFLSKRKLDNRIRGACNVTKREQLGCCIYRWPSQEKRRRLYSRPVKIADTALAHSLSRQGEPLPAVDAHNTIPSIDTQLTNSCHKSIQHIVTRSTFSVNYPLVQALSPPG